MCDAHVFYPSTRNIKGVFFAVPAATVVGPYACRDTTDPKITVLLLVDTSAKRDRVDALHLSAHYVYRGSTAYRGFAYYNANGILHPPPPQSSHSLMIPFSLAQFWKLGQGVTALAGTSPW